MARWPWPYEVNWSKGFQQAPLYVNDLSGGRFGYWFLVVVWMMFGIGYWISKKDALGAFAIAGFMTFLVGLFMWLGDIVSGITFGIVVAVMILGFAGLFIPRNE